MGAIFGKLRVLLSRRKLEAVLVGLDASGKTTLLNLLSMVGVSD